jgi:carbamoyltransferase
VARKPLYILGLCYGGQHESSVALLCDGRVVATWENSDRAFPLTGIELCLNTAGISIHEIDRAAFFWQPWRGVGLRIGYALRGLPASFGRGTKNAGVLFTLLTAERTFKKATGYRGPFHFVDHTLAHAAHTFYTSGFEKAAIIVADGTGETKTCWVGESDGKKFTEHASAKWPHSLGHVYAAVTEYLGFESFKDENEVMLLAARGTPHYLSAFREIIKSTSDGLFRVDLRYFDYPFSRTPRYSRRLTELFAGAKREDIAASLQARLEEMLIDLARLAVQKSGESNLCLAGGVMYNSLAIEKLRASGVAKNIYVPTHPGAPSAVPVSPGCVGTYIFFATPLARSFSTASELYITPPARQRFSWPDFFIAN